MEERLGEIRRLQRCLNDLIGLSALPTVWFGREPAHIVRTLLDVLLRLLSLDFVYARLRFQPEQPAIETVRFALAADAAMPASGLGEVIQPWLKVHQPFKAYVIPHPCGEGAVSIVHLWMGPDRTAGVIAAASRRIDFPSEIETLLLRVAVSQALIELQRAQVLAERARTAEAQRASEERFRRYFELGLVGMAITSPTKGCVEVNERFCDMVGYTRGELLKMTWAQITNAEDLAADVAQFDRVMAGETDGYSMDKRYIHKDGQVVHAIISVKCLRCPDGSVDYFLSLVQDISARKRAEEDLRLAHEELEHRVIERTGQLAAVNRTLTGEVAERKRAEEELKKAFDEISLLKDRLAREKLYLEEEILTEKHFEEVIGESEALRAVLTQIEKVAPVDSTVLIQGETGTGKELLARALHRLSRRHDRTFVKVNCAAIPTGLLESELFGHEKGAFTGAVAQRIGRFELAHHGTLFLDEVGEIPLELQVKLLRVLQEQEFERLGSTRTLRVDVRLVAATNRDLAQMIANNQFRSDLYYRLNVFPITMPPLRERVEDIPLLLRHFTRHHAQLCNKPITAIAPETVAALCRYSWPGNVRELENVVERSVILSQGPVLEVALPQLKAPLAMQPPTTPSSNGTTLENIQREHILNALDDAHWVIGGPHGAAVRLGVKRTSLQYKMRKLGISRPH
jgi:PAS domain S-box-containing protein